MTLSSGGDTTLQGAIVDAHRVEGEVAGNLRINSSPDRSTCNSKPESAGLNVSLCVPPICYGT